MQLAHVWITAAMYAVSADIRCHCLAASTRVIFSRAPGFHPALLWTHAIHMSHLAARCNSSGSAWLRLVCCFVMPVCCVAMGEGADKVQLVIGLVFHTKWTFSRSISPNLALRVNVRVTARGRSVSFNIVSRRCASSLDDLNSIALRYNLL